MKQENTKTEQDKIKNQIVTEWNRTMGRNSKIKENDLTVNFNFENLIIFSIDSIISKVNFWAQLTKTGRVKKNSIRIDN